MIREPVRAFPTRPIYILAMVGVSLGSAAVVWQARDVGWAVPIFAVAWVGMVAAFVWEVVTRAHRLDEIVRSRTDALERANEQLTGLLEETDSFRRISYEINQNLELKGITGAFAGGVCRLFPQVHAVGLWLDGERLSPDFDAMRRGALRARKFGLAALCVREGRVPGGPADVAATDPLMGPCFQGESVTLRRSPFWWPGRTGWEWLADSPVRCFAGVPLQLGDGLLGVVGIFGCERLSAQFLRQVHLAVNQVAVALENARLLDHLRKRAEELARVNKDLCQLDAMKDWFISSVSHELRTPLTSIRSFSEILQDWPGLSPAERVEFAGTIREESERLSQLIDEMLDLAKIARGEAGTHPAHFDLGALIGRCQRLFSRQAQERGVEFRCRVSPGLPPAFAEEMSAARVLHNLIANALKFTADGGRVEVSARTFGPDTLTVLVRDTGVGIAPRDQERVFERFSQVGDGLTDKTPGAGLGLAICRELVARWQGRIWVESEPGRGSTFGFTLPVARPEADGATRSIGA